MVAARFLFRRASICNYRRRASSSKIISSAISITWRNAVLGDDVDFFVALVSTGTVTGGAPGLGVSPRGLTMAVLRL
jgi:hypothetical protein